MLPAFILAISAWNKKTIKFKQMLTVILMLAGLICFWLFFKAIDFSEKILHP